MGFTLRFILGVILVLTAGSVLISASPWRRVRQTSSTENLPDSDIPQNDIKLITTVNIKRENTTRNATNKGEIPKPPRLHHGKQKIRKNEQKTENSTENSYTIANLNINSNNSDNKIINDNKNESNLEKPFLNKESDNQKDATKHVPDNGSKSPVSRADDARYLDMDISKYLSPEFHNINNVYNFSVSPDTERYSNLHNEILNSTPSWLSSEINYFSTEISTKSYQDYHKKFEEFEEGIKQKLESIDHDFSKPHSTSQQEEPINISKILDEVAKNETTVNLDYEKIKNIVANTSRDKNKIHKDYETELSHNVYYNSSFNNTQIFEETPKDYKNKIPTNEGDFKPPKQFFDRVPLETPIIDGKESEATTLENPENLGTSPKIETQTQKVLFSNKIESEIINPAENNIKLDWEFSSTTPLTLLGRRTTKRSGQDEELMLETNGKENAITVAKRGSTRYADTIKTVTTTTTESWLNNNLNKSRPTTLRYNKNKLNLANKQLIAEKENKTLEQSVLENQVYPVQVPAPNKITEKFFNLTSEEPFIMENVTLFKLYTISNTPTAPTTLNQTTETNINFVVTETTTTVINNSLDSATTKDGTTVGKFAAATTEQVTVTMDDFNASGSEVQSTTASPIHTTTLSMETAVPYDVTTTFVNDTTGMVVDGSSQETTPSEEVSSDYTEKFDNNNSSTSSYEDGDRSSTLSASDYSEDDGRLSSGRDLKEQSDEPSYFSTSPEGSSASTEDTPTNFTNNDLTTAGDVTELKTTIDYRDNTIVKQTAPISNATWDISGLTESQHNVTEIPQSQVNSTQLPQSQVNSTQLFQSEVTATEIPGSHVNATEIPQTQTAVTETPRSNFNATELPQSQANATEIPQTQATVTETPRSHVDTTEIPRSEVNVTENFGGDHSVLVPKNIISRVVEESTTETVPFIIPLNVSMLDTDGTESTTIGDNLQLGTEEKNEGGGGPVAAIVISCIGAVCLLLLAGLLFIMRKRHKRFNYGQRCTPVSLDAYSVDNVSVYNSLRRKAAMRSSKRSYGNPAFDDPTAISRMLNFPALAKFAGNTEGIVEEFEEIPQVTAQTNELPEGCETKNRYANVIPLPETRVFLNANDGYPNSDYINANYVTGPRSTKCYYIACQAPMQNTVDDFWRMVWEQQSKVVLMLTHLFENGAEKCIDYLPPSEVLDCHRLFGDYQVTLKKREVKEKYVISSLQLKNMVSNSWREVTHLWYLGWPEKGVPSEANSLIAFLIEARSYIKLSPAENGKPNENFNNEQVSNGTATVERSPVIIHCSPGTGRTGTVIACDIAIREFELTRQVDIPKTVYKIRRDRASSVQTKEQYAFIYKVISLYATKLTGEVLDSI